MGLVELSSTHAVWPALNTDDVKPVAEMMMLLTPPLAGISVPMSPETKVMLEVLAACTLSVTEKTPVLATVVTLSGRPIPLTVPVITGGVDVKASAKDAVLMPNAIKAVIKK